MYVDLCFVSFSLTNSDDDYNLRLKKHSLMLTIAYFIRLSCLSIFIFSNIASSQVISAIYIGYRHIQLQRLSRASLQSGDIVGITD
jgi:hypothetical protein